LDVADFLSSEGVVKGISSLKMEIGKMLTQISDKLDEEVKKFKGIKKAISIKEDELKEIYEIEKSAATLAALIESQNQKRLEFESEITAGKDELSREIETTRAEWGKEKNAHEADFMEQGDREIQEREREKEEYDYTFKREQKLIKDKFEDEKARLDEEKARLEKEIQTKREEVEKELADREGKVVEKEEELINLQKTVDSFPKDMETAVNKTIKETTESIKREAKSREDLQKKEFDGERNVLTTKIESLQRTVEEQNAQIKKLSEQLEKAYQKVQDIAVKAIEGSSTFKSLTGLEQMMADQVRRQPQEK